MDQPQRDDTTSPDQTEPAPSLSDDALQSFWRVVRSRAGVGNADVYLGTPWGEAVVPPAWSFGDSPAMADRLLALVLSGAKRATTGVQQDYTDQDEPLPRPGELSIILDGAGIPRALVREIDVEVLPFGQVSAEQAAAEGEDDLSLESWRAAHRAAFARSGYEVDDETLVVYERFEVLYP